MDYSTHLLGRIVRRTDRVSAPDPAGCRWDSVKRKGGNCHERVIGHHARPGPLECTISITCHIAHGETFVPAPVERGLFARGKAIFRRRADAPAPPAFPPSSVGWRTPALSKPRNKAVPYPRNGSGRSRDPVTYRGAVQTARRGARASRYTIPPFPRLVGTTGAAEIRRENTPEAPQESYISTANYGHSDRIKVNATTA